MRTAKLCGCAHGPPGSELERRTSTADFLDLVYPGLRSYMSWESYGESIVKGSALKKASWFVFFSPRLFRLCLADLPDP